MSSMDHSPRMFSRPTYHNHHHHTMSAYHAPSYSMPYEDSVSRGTSYASPYLPETRPPRRRQQATSSLSFISPAVSRPEQQPEPTSCSARRPAERTERAPICISPFRSVRKMKEPFQLRLPSSPSLESVVASAREVKASRPMSGHQTLRTWRSDQNLAATSLETFGLLPSPPLSDSRESRPSTSSTYFSPKIDSEVERGRGRTPVCSCTLDTDSCHACYPLIVKTTKPEKRVTEPTNVHATHSHLVKRCETDEGRFTPASTDSERTLSPSEYSDIDIPEREDVCDSADVSQRSRAGTVSSEASSWLPSDLSYFERWLQGVPESADLKDERSKESNRRRCQIVGDSLLRLDRKCEIKAADEAVRLDLTKTKPKLVDISRQSSLAMSHAVATPQISTPKHQVPSTPDMRLQEVSAFSPDTPLEISDGTHVPRSANPSANDLQDDKYTDSISLHSEPASGIVVYDKLVLREGPSFSPPKPKLALAANSSPRSYASPSRSSNMSEKEERWWWDLEWTIEQLEQSVKDFPRNMLKLTSPVIMFLRQNNEKALIRPFRKIFPEVKESLLDCLCAVLIARNHLVSLPSSSRGVSNSSHRSAFSRLDTVPERAYAATAVQFSPGSPSSIKDRFLGPRTAELRTDLDRIVDNLLFAICGRSDEILKSAVLVLAQVLETKT